jgi:HEAT repeat protein
MRATSYLTVLIVCAVLGVLVSAQGAPATPARVEATTLVESLRHLPAPMPSGRTFPATEEQRWRAIERLRVLGPEGVTALARALADPDPMMRRNALIGLQSLASGISTRKVPPVDVRAGSGALVHALLTDPDWYVRAWAAATLGQIQPPPPEVVGALTAALKDSWVGVRLSACRAVGQIGDRRAAVVDALKNALKDAEADVRTCARHVVSKMAG